MRSAFFVLLLMWGTVGLSFGADTPAVTGGTSSFIYDVAPVLGVSEGKTDPLPALKAYVAEPTDGNLDALVKAFNESDFSRLHLAVTSATSILDASPGVQLHDTPDWPYGTVKARLAIQSLMWAKAGAFAKSDAAKSKAYGRAAILFAAQDDFPAGAYHLNKFFRDKAGMANAGLDDNQTALLTDLLKKRSTGDAHAAARKAVDRLFKHPESNDYKQAIDALQKWFDDHDDESGKLERVIRITVEYRAGPYRHKQS